MQRQFRSFSYKDTNLKVFGTHYNEMVEEIVLRRKQLESYIRRHPEFQTSLFPVSLRDDPPEAAIRMAAAAAKTGLGPMASVAGTLAQFGVEKALSLGDDEAIVENGGDTVLAVRKTLTIGIHTIDEVFKDKLAFVVENATLAICSSSGVMGHSLSLGACGLATVVAVNAAIADSAATLLCNSVSQVSQIQSALERVGKVEGVDGAMVIHDGRIGLWGQLPQIVKNEDAGTPDKITRDRFSPID